MATDDDYELPPGAKRKTGKPSDGEVDEMERIAMSDEHYADLLDEFDNGKTPKDRVAALKALVQSCKDDD